MARNQTNHSVPAAAVFLGAACFFSATPLSESYSAVPGTDAAPAADQGFQVPARKPERQAEGASSSETWQTARVSTTPVPKPEPDTVLEAEEPKETLPELSDGNRDALRTVLEALSARQGERALALALALEDPIDRKIANWRLARSGSPAVSSAFIDMFRKAEPAWPSQKVLQSRYEVALSREKPAAEKVIELFGDQKPVTVAGTRLLAKAYLEAERKEDAHALISEMWRTERLSSVLEKRILADFGSLLDEDDHNARVDLFLYADRSKAALRNASRISDARRKLVDARIAVIRRSKSAGKLLAAVPESLKSDPGYFFSRVQHLRRAKKPEDAIALLLKAPTDSGVLVDPDEWWVERKLNARKALELGQHQDAYDIAASHAAISPADKAEAEFHAGWFALRFLDRPTTALVHFDAIEKIGTTPITRSRALYWMARAEEARGNEAAARENYLQASRYTTAFYGQLAREKLGHTNLGLTDVPEPGDAEKAAFAANEMIIGIHRLENAGFESLGVALYRQLGKTLDDPGVLALVIAMAQAEGRHQIALMVGKEAVTQNPDFALLAFPVAAIPPKARVKASVGKPIVYAIARQESAFNPGAISHAGARGLLQLMPATARATARRAGLSYSKRRLTSDPAYNATLGAAHLEELLERFNGSYILTFAAYNAGSSRSWQWIKRFGDPRTEDVDPIDWIEHIPFTETRNYVQRIMENLVMYRARFEQDRLQITKDLTRG